MFVVFILLTISADNFDWIVAQLMSASNGNKIQHVYAAHTQVVYSTDEASVGRHLEFTIDFFAPKTQKLFGFFFFFANLAPNLMVFSNGLSVRWL